VSVDPPIRIFLSPPDVGSDERELLLDAFDSNWIAPLGPHVDAFEREMAAYLDVGHAVALSSGTAALHLALMEAGVGPGDEVLCSTLTFAATANAIRYVGADPVFVDANPHDWNLDVEVVAEELKLAARDGRRIAAVVAVDLYGRCCDYAVLEPLCAEYEVPLIEDAAEALGAKSRGRAAGAFGMAGVLSFNGNKIITTSGGGMLVTDDAKLATHARYLATQAREPVAHYEHLEVGYNYRMSNLLAAVGRGQLRTLDAKVARRREIRQRYEERLGDLPGVRFAPLGDEDNGWLTCLTIDPVIAGADREVVRKHLRARGIEARPLWKPMHMQPVYEGNRALGGEVASGLFTQGLCLPSGSSLKEEQQEGICTSVAEMLDR
jgi:dTDP-4-amino-4,6-dideoxygalactose transaminase